MFKSKILWLGAALILLASLVGLIWVYFQPLASPLDLTVSPTAVPPAPQPLTPQPTAALVIPGTCGQTGVSTILFMARDTSNGNPPFGADTIRFIRLDYSQKKVTIVAVPRDLWLLSPVLSGQNILYSRLGPVFYLVEQATSGDQKAKYKSAVNAVAQTLYDNFQVTPDHYIFFEMRSFATAIDNLGGMDITIPKQATSGAYTFNVGSQHLTGGQALIYASFLPSQDELTDGWDRLDRQNLILNGLRTKLLDPVNYVQIPGLVELFWNDITTDLSPALIQNITCMLKEVSQENISMIAVDKNMITGPGPDNSMIPDVGKVVTFLQTQLAK